MPCLRGAFVQSRGTGRAAPGNAAGRASWRQGAGPHARVRGLPLASVCARHARAARVVCPGRCTGRCRAARDLGASANGPDGVQIYVASESAEYRAAAYLRAAAFYHYPPGRSELAAASHRRMRGDQEWQELEEKVAGASQIWSACDVQCILASVDSESELGRQVLDASDRSTQLPASGDAEARVAVGTLDINVGPRIPSEDLQGALPGSDDGRGDPGKRRAYLSNVCVSDAARRRGIARALIDAAHAVAGREGVEHMYVHVVVENKAAVELYKAAGYDVESEESAAQARARARPRRLLLHRRLD